MHRPQARHVLPEFTERTSHGTRTLDPYSKLHEGRIVILGTEIDETAANDAIAQLLHLEYAAPEQDISVYVNSPGGSITAMTAIYDTMQVITCDVGTTCLGQAGSVAAVLLAAGAPGKRFALPGSRVVLRQPAIAEPVHGRPSDLLVHTDEVLRQRRLTESLLSRHTGRTAAQVAADLERDLVLDAPEAVRYGMVDGIVDRRAPRPGQER